MSWPVLVLCMAIAFTAGVMTDVILPEAASCARSDAWRGAGTGELTPSDASAARRRLADGSADALDEMLDPVDPILPGAPRSAR